MIGRVVLLVNPLNDDAGLRLGLAKPLSKVLRQGICPRPAPAPIPELRFTLRRH